MTRSAAKPLPAETSDAPPAKIRSLCFQIARDLRTALDRDLACFGLRAQQAAVLLRCCRQPGANPSQLAAAVGTDTAGVTGLIDQLEKHGLVIRRGHPADRRAVIVEPTRAGRTLAPRLREVFQAVNDVLLEGFSPQEAARLEGKLQRLRANVREYLVEEIKGAKIQLATRRLRASRLNGPQDSAPAGVPEMGGSEG